MRHLAGHCCLAQPRPPPLGRKRASQAVTPALLSRGNTAAASACSPPSFIRFGKSLSHQATQSSAHREGRRDVGSPHLRHPRWPDSAPRPVERNDERVVPARPYLTRNHRAPLSHHPAVSLPSFSS